jgi:predicted acylesterase/phospholipase RssA
MQLPVWLLNHVVNNVKNIRKSLLKKESLADDEIILEKESDLTITLNSMNSIKNTDYFRVGLSLDGGGIRGMLLATELHYLATRVGYPLHKIFDCIGGTSIGGILALASTGTHDGENPVANT